jgi:hypothetical protein
MLRSVYIALLLICGSSLHGCLTLEKAKIAEESKAADETIYLRYVGKAPQGPVFDIAFVKGETGTAPTQRAVSPKCVVTVPVGVEYEARLVENGKAFEIVTWPQSGWPQPKCYAFTVALAKTRPLKTFQAFEIFTETEAVSGRMQQDQLSEIIKSIGRPIKAEFDSGFQIYQWCKTWTDDEFGIGLFKNGALVGYGTYRVPAREGLDSLGLRETPEGGVDCNRLAKSQVNWAKSAIYREKIKAHEDAFANRQAQLESERERAVQFSVSKIEARLKSEKSTKVLARQISDYHEGFWFEIQGKGMTAPFFVAQSCSDVVRSQGSWFDALLLSDVIVISREKGHTCTGKLSNNIAGKPLRDFLNRFPTSASKYGSFKEAMPPSDFGVKDCRQPGCTDAESKRFQNFMMWRKNAMQADLAAARALSQSILQGTQPRREDVIRIKCSQHSDIFDELLGTSKVECELRRP